jgi:hypothetical protein
VVADPTQAEAPRQLPHLVDISDVAWRDKEQLTWGRRGSRRAGSRLALVIRINLDWTPPRSLALGLVKFPGDGPDALPHGLDQCRTARSRLLRPSGFRLDR